MSDKVFKFTFQEDDDTRLDKFLVNCLPELSRSRIQGLIRDGFVLIDGVPAEKSGQTVEKGQLIELRLPPPVPTDLVPESIPLEIIFENDDVMVVNKPAGMVVHPAAGHESGTLVHAALAHAPEMEGISGEERPGVVHRLDKDTSGLILLAKNDRSQHWLQDQFRLRKVIKVYQAVVDGHPPTPQGRVEAPIGRDPSHRKQMAVVPITRGREAVTEYFTQESFLQHTYLEAHPLTGRTHQIRLHMAFIGCPIVGDRLYGHKHVTLTIDRQFLHAARLTVVLPGEKKARTFEAALPADLEQVLSYLRQNSAVKIS
ncbi:MAG: RluA family pseudouridine synthase [Anaerolineaceae bacterium]|nr:RluA family pseudouridine synthase [Anaerolineaceae bacterium]